MTSVTGATNFSQKVHSLKTEHADKKGNTLGPADSGAAHSKNEVKKADDELLTPESAKQQHNTAILEASLNISVSSGNDPLALLYKTAIEGINEALKPTLGENAIQSAYDSGLDVSPDATAERIVSFSTALFSKYLEQNDDIPVEEAVVKFAEIIGGGIDKGFSEARDILNGLGVLEGGIAANIDSTYDLVQDGLKAFVDSYLDNEDVESE